MSASARCSNFKSFREVERLDVTVFMIRVRVYNGHAGAFWFKGEIVVWIFCPPCIDLRGIGRGVLETVLGRGDFKTFGAWENGPPSGRVFQRCFVQF